VILLSSQANTVYGALRGLEVCKEFASQSSQTFFFLPFTLFGGLKWRSGGGKRR